jgi:NAD(P)H-flavin reductase
MVTSWEAGPQKSLDLFIEPRRGLTLELFYHTKARESELFYHAKDKESTGFLILFTGPHGKSIPVDKYETILMVASGFGIAAQLPYLRRLVHGFNRDLCVRRVHLVWQIRDKGEICIITLSLVH